MAISSCIVNTTPRIVERKRVGRGDTTSGLSVERVLPTDPTELDDEE
jgi:hypothetical protein